MPWLAAASVTRPEREGRTNGAADGVRPGEGWSRAAFGSPDASTASEELLKGGAVVGGVGASREGSGSARTSSRKPPIPFEVAGLDGKPMSLAAAKGKPAMLIFWSSQDPDCAAEIVAIAEWTKPFEQRGLVVLSVSLDRKVDGLKKFMAEQKINWRTHCDGKGKRNALALKYDVRLLPEVYMMSEDGLLRFTGTRGRLVPLRLQKLFDRDYEEVVEEEEEE